MALLVSSKFAPSPLPSRFFGLRQPPTQIIYKKSPIVDCWLKLDNWPKNKKSYSSNRDGWPNVVCRFM
jgi:hypothetical protein